MSEETRAPYPRQVSARPRQELWHLSQHQALWTHAREDCSGHCCLHNPSSHHMSTWKLWWRDDWTPGFMERICPDRGIGHPDPDQVAYWKINGLEGHDVHGCCGCCNPGTYASLLLDQVAESLEPRLDGATHREDPDSNPGAGHIQQQL